ncbi:MAG: hypothetical protein ACM3Q4_14650 [Acidobacteriota bacterium]
MITAIKTIGLILLCAGALRAQGSIEQLRTRVEQALEARHITEDQLQFASSLHLRLEGTLRRDVPRPYAYQYLNEFLAAKDSIDVRFTGDDLTGTFTYWEHGKETKLYIDIVMNDDGVEGINISRHGRTNLFHDVHPK